MRSNLVRLFLILGAALFASRASAAVAIYSDYASWSAAAGSVSTLAIPDVPNPPYYNPPTANAAPITIGGVTFSLDPSLGNVGLYQIGSGFTGYAPVVTALVDVPGGADTPNIRISFGRQLNALSFNYLSVFGTNVTFTLSNGDKGTLTSTGIVFGSPVFDFFGINDTSSFDEILITAPDLSLSVNDLAFTSPVAPVPEVATWVMMLLGLVAIGGLGRAWPYRGQAVG